MESITFYMEQDHVAIDAMAQRASAAAAAGNLATLASEAGEFVRRLRQHIAMEEDVLFPVFEQRTGMAAAGPSRQMRIEHDMMRPLLGRIEAAVAVQDAVGFEQNTRELFEILQPHNMKEEQILYPMIDSVAGEDAPGLVEKVKGMA